jgi:hypothetical protein
MISRKLLVVEKQLLVALPINSQKYIEYIEKHMDQLLVSEMEDGGMGSLHFLSTHSDEYRRSESCIAEVETRDSDDVSVLICLDIDNFGDLYELDIWKVNFEPLISMGHCIESLEKKRGL